jgi:hypothetical protein
MESVSGDIDHNGRFGQALTIGTPVGAFKTRLPETPLVRSATRLN